MDAFKSLLLFLLSPVAFAGPVNLNSADAETIAAELDGVGIARARAIVDYRNEHGAFETADDVLNVKGVGEKLLDLNRRHIRLESPVAD